MNYNPNSSSMDPNEETIERPDDVETGMPAMEDEEEDRREQDPATDQPDPEDEQM